MKNYPNKDYSGKKNNRSKKALGSKDLSKYDNPSDVNNTNPKNSNLKNKSSFKKNNFNKVNFKDKDKNNLIYSKTRSLSKRSEKEAFNTGEINYNEIQAKKKSFDDWIWGKHSVYEALKGDRSINRIWCTSEIYSSERFYLLLKELKSKGVLIEEVSWNRLSQLTFGAAHQGVVLQLAYSKSISLEQLINISKANARNPIILALDGITDPHNLGAIIRSAEAFDCKGIVLPQRRSAGLTGTVAKVAAGALEHMPISRVVNLNRAIEELKENGFLVIGLSGDGKLPISNFNEDYPLVVIIGSEEKGKSLLVQKKCDYLLRIPLKGKTSSLNASVAAAISLFHLTNKNIK